MAGHADERKHSPSFPDIQTSRYTNSVTDTNNEAGGPRSRARASSESEVVAIAVPGLKYTLENLVLSHRRPEILFIYCRGNPGSQEVAWVAPAYLPTSLKFSDRHLVETAE